MSLDQCFSNLNVNLDPMGFYSKRDSDWEVWAEPETVYT